MRFSLLARRWRRALDARLAEAGLTDTTWTPLIYLDETGGGINQQELAHLVGVDGSSLVRVIDILERHDLIVRRRDEADGRARLIHLTVKGKNRVAEIRRELSVAEAEMLVDLSDDEIDLMLDCFGRLEQRMHSPSPIRANR